MRSPVNVIASKAIRNYCINGQFDFAQRRPSGNWLNEGDRYTADRWYRYKNGGGDAGVSATIQDAGLNNGIKSFNISRTSGSALLTDQQLLQALESKDSKELAGKKVTFSVKVRKGVGFTGTNFTIYLEIGTGTDQAAAAAWTGALNIGALVTPVASISSSSFTQLSLTTTLPSNTNQIRMIMFYTPTGVAGPSDYMEITEVMLNEGEFTPYVRAGGSFAGELDLCQRYYEKSYNLATLPGTGSDEGRVTARSDNTGNFQIAAVFKVRKRAQSNGQVYSTAGSAPGFVRINAAPITASVTNSETSLKVASTAPATANADGEFQWTAEAEL